jgi:antitoxin PrlF
MITSKLTSKAQTTVPQAVRNALGVKPGDELVYAIEAGRVIVTNAPKPAPGRPTEDDPFMLFDEWASEADRRAYEDL